MRPAVKLVRTQVPLEVQIEEAEEMEVDIFSDDLVNGNEAGKDMNVDPTELLESVADTPEQQQSTASRTNNSTTPTSSDVTNQRQRPCTSREMQAALHCGKAIGYERRGSGTTSLSGLAPSASISSRSESTDPHTSRSNNCPCAR